MVLPKIQQMIPAFDGFKIIPCASVFEATLRVLTIFAVVVAWGCSIGGGSLEGTLAARGGSHPDAGARPTDGGGPADGGGGIGDAGGTADGGNPTDGAVVLPPLPPLAPNATPVWQDYYRARTAGGTPILPDFSYAGYRRGDHPIPEVQGPIFDVTQFGAVAGDGQSDRAAIEAAISAAETQGGGVVFFPPGRFRVNEVPSRTEHIRISGSNIILRGSGSGPGGSELFMQHHLVPMNPNEPWATPSVIGFASSVRPVETSVTTVTADATRESHRVQVADPSALRAGQWVILRREDVRGTEAFLAPHRPRPEWTRINTEGVTVAEIHQIRRIEGNTLVFETPIHVDVNAQHAWRINLFAHIEEVGVEDLAFVGNWHERFEHGRNALHDTGFSALRIELATNSWIRRCRFVDWTKPVQVGGAANVTVEDLVLEGNPGHHAIFIAGATHVLVKDIDDRLGAWHGPGVGGPSSGTVFLRVRSMGRTSPELHAVYPHDTLYDNVAMGLFHWRAGGATFNVPNHLRHLVLWNYRGLGESIGGYNFWSAPGGFVVTPIIVGFHGNSTTFDATKLQLLESMGQPVVPESLYEAQKALRAALPPP